MTPLGTKLPPRQYEVDYAPSMPEAIEKNVRLESGEEFIASTLIQTRKNWLIRRPGMLGVTDRRLFFLEHHLFSPDSILEIPRSALVSIGDEEKAPSGWVELSYSASGGSHTMRVRPFALRGSPSGGEIALLLDTLVAFQHDELSWKSVERAAESHASAAGPPSYLPAIGLAAISLLLLVRVAYYVSALPSEWHAKRVYDTTSTCNPSRLAASGDTTAPGLPASNSQTAEQQSFFCEVQTLTVLRVWSAGRAPYQHSAFIDARGKIYEDVAALNSAKSHLWWQMRSGDLVRVLFAGGLPAWILHQGNLFETRQNPDHKFTEQSTLLLVGTLFFTLFAFLTIYVFRQTLLTRRRVMAR